MDLRPLWPLLETVLTPLYFARRRRWLGLVLNTPFFAGGVLLAVGLLEAGSPGGALAAAFFSWLLCYAGVISSKRSQALAAGPPPPSMSRQLAEAGLILVVGAITLVGAVGLISRQDLAPAHASRYQAAALEASWIVERARRYREAHGRNPAGLGALIEAEPPARIDPQDLWGRPWMLSPAFGVGGVQSGELWVCSRGPRGGGKCGPEAGGAAGSVGFGERAGAWSSTWSPGWAEHGERALHLLLFLGPVVAFGVYRIVRRIRGNPAPRMQGAVSVGLFLILMMMYGATAIPLNANIVERAREAKARADIRALAAAVEEYRARTGAPPAQLADLTLPVAGVPGGTAGPLVEHLPRAPFPASEYRYRRWPDGRYYILWNDASSRRPAAFHASGETAPGRR